MHDSTLRRRVARGAALLDEEMPGWEEQIDLEKLNLNDCSRCVLGQLYGDYDDGIEALDLDWGVPSARLGFTFAGEGDSRWARLTDKWRRQIRRRLRGRAA